MKRRTLITPKEIREFIAECSGWASDHNQYKQFWGPFLDTEIHMRDWVKDWIEKFVSDHPDVSRWMKNEEDRDTFGGMLLDYFLAGVWFGERRWAIRNIDVIADIKDVHHD